MPKADSIDKIVRSYFACVAAEPFTYKGVTYQPKPLRLSPMLHRGYTCPSHCGACCSRFSLDYLPSEAHPYKLHKRLVEFDGRQVVILSDMQDDHDNHHCRNLSMADGRCGIHGVHPFSCDFELIRFLTFAAADKPNTLTQKLYGRAHAMLRIDGGRGAMCEMLKPNDERKAAVVRKLQRLREWCDHFGLKHRVTEIITWAEKGPWMNATVIGTEGRVPRRAR